MMGKKSRLKKERCVKAALDAASGETANAVKAADAAFERRRSDLEVVFSRFNAEDVCVSLCVSDLWLPNISSQVKHTFAFAVAASMKPDRFIGTNRIETYPQFHDFISNVYALFPHFEMLEDYVPEADWGEVKFNSMGSLLRIYYGGAVERIPDFITAFQIVNSNDAAALQDMHAALSVQNHIISSIDPSYIGGIQDIEPGHIEIPVETFWAKCRDAVLSASVLSETSRLSAGLAAKLGQLTPPRTWMDFGDAVITGSVLPAFLLEIGTRRFPMALRNAAAVVVQYWADKRVDTSALAKTSSGAIGAFLAQRFDTNSVVAGPLKLVTRSQSLPYSFAAAMMGGPKFYLIVALPENTLSQLPKIEAAVSKMLRDNTDWALKRENKAGATQIRKRDGALPTSGDFVLVAVLAWVTTVPGVLKLPKTKARVLPLPDFVTIYDSTDEVEELDRFWSFIDDHARSIGGFSGAADRFAAFRDSDALLVDGAITPTFIGLDPHWGSTWRYRQLTKFWLNAPPLFPDDESIAWAVERDSESLYQLVARYAPVLSWCATVDGCVVHFMFAMTAQPLKAEDGRILELVVHCLADALAQRQTIVSGLSLFKHRRIVTVCRGNPALLATGADDTTKDEPPLFSDWSLTSKAGDASVRVSVHVNLRHVKQRVTDPVDASFEAASAIAWINGLSDLLGMARDPAILEAAISSGSRRPRFTLKVLPRLIDVPEFAKPIVPRPEHYKIARRDLAIVFRELGAQEGKYELIAAKALIDPARDKFRSLLHGRIAALNRHDLVVFCVEQLDALTAKYDQDSMRIQISLAHEVSYNRSERLAEAHGTFVQESRNYRYLLECCLSLPASESRDITSQEVVEIVASIDWLQVLYGASDVLHNGIDVAGLELDHMFIPHVYYSEGWDERENAFAAETADLKLGVDVTLSDQVNPVREDSDEWRLVDDAFQRDTGTRLNHLIASLLVLSRWPSANEESELRWSYTVSRVQVRDVLVKSITDLKDVEADKIISLITIDLSRIRLLLGKSVDESDVPIWEHNKRGNRYPIKPLIMLDPCSLLWGAAAAERAARIWRSNIANGHLPADFEWPHVAEALRTIKARLDEKLEVTALDVVQRSTPYVLGGIDFMRRFPKESFEDVGDYDVLAYWPDTNRWLVVECKYNQPAFCLKDARRLRERIFGTEKDRAQFSKIERRRAFFSSNADQLRALLAWPPPNTATAAFISETYVSRDIYWWMRNPPYEIPTHFVRIDVLANWLRAHGLLK